MVEPASDKTRQDLRRVVTKAIRKHQCIAQRSLARQPTQNRRSSFGKAARFDQSPRREVTNIAFRMSEQLDASIARSPRLHDGKRGCRLREHVGVFGTRERRESSLQNAHRFARGLRFHISPAFKIAPRRLRRQGCSNNRTSARAALRSSAWRKSRPSA
ncbi:MAG TPA: hypothetical protein VH083_07400, partial [Myxococcales bacterium]|nr:hypothetical protein [Myxococcales bacterium]